MKTFEQDMKELMVCVKKVMMSNSERTIDKLREARDNGAELSMRQIINMFSDYNIVNNEYDGITLYVLAPDKSWIYGVEFLCVDEDYETFIVDSIIYPHDYNEYM